MVEISKHKHLRLLFVLFVFLVFDRSYGLEEEEEEDKVRLDFAIAGFAKCSTTYLRNNLLSSIDNIFFGNDNNEIHYLHKNNVPAFKQLFKGHVGTINGFKCPDLLYSETGLSNLETHFNQTDLIIAVRHPILWFQSFYNYRVRNGFDLPEPHLLIGSCPTSFEDRLDVNNEEVRGVKAHKVCSDRAQFHIAMSRLGKTSMNSADEMNLLRNHSLSVHHFKNKIFLMEIGQLSVANNSSADQFIRDLEEFLNLRNNSLPKLREHQPRHHITFDVEDIEQKIIDICKPKYHELRQILLSIGIDASKWIREYFLKSDSVYVSQRATFEHLILQWEVDPCVSTKNNDDDVESEEVM